MRITDFATNLFTKFAPLAPEALASLNSDLSFYYTKYLKTMSEKTSNNELIEKKAASIKREIESAEKGSPEYDRALFQFTELQDQLEEPTIMEKVIGFLDKPLVRTLLLISFAFAARYLAKKLTTPVAPKDEELEDSEQQNGFYNSHKPQPNYNYQPPFYPQYNYQGYPVPPQQYQHQGK